MLIQHNLARFNPLSTQKSYLFSGLIPGQKILAFLVLIAGGLSSGRAEWRVNTISGSPAITSGVTISANGDLILAEKTPIPAAIWYSLRRTDQPLPEPTTGPVLYFTNGDRLPGRLLDSDGTTIRVQPAFADPKSDHPLTVSLSSVNAWFLRIPTDSEYLETQSKPRSRDLLVNRRGDSLAGSIATLDDTGFRLQDGPKTTLVERGTVTAVFFNTELARVRKPKGRYYRVRFTDGTRYAVAGLSVDETTCRLTTFAKEAFAVPLSQVISIDVEQGPAIWIGDFKPLRNDYQPFDGESRLRQTDRNALGHPLRLAEPKGESTYACGLGLTGGMSLTYDLGGKFKRFEALAGMDARDGRVGEAILRFLRDGKPVELPDGGRVGLKPVEMIVDVAGCKTLTITVERDRHAGVQDILNLANARLIP
ncbi:NPCBM/NEW2 domain-containing protein [Zavarzinella formosa]|uniref:NPCBM/NEW2 domain-containing protein n=1 Tax=Zavarzinella formosa TaxID=360055 RepID=UPI0002F733FE|nr:NPCBM/NEW2 domain-containing protein [Zavarzinella formosa]